MFILDSDTLTLLFAGHEKVTARRDTVPSNEIATSIVTQIEILRGRFDYLLKAETGEDLLRAQAKLDRTIAALATVETIFPVGKAAAAEFDRLHKNKKLKKIGRADLLIACITLAHRATLVTRNLRHFQQVPGLQVENWAD